MRTLQTLMDTNLTRKFSISLLKIHGSDKLSLLLHFCIVSHDLDVEGFLSKNCVSMEMMEKSLRERILSLRMIMKCNLTLQIRSCEINVNTFSNACISLALYGAVSEIEQENEGYI